MGSPTENDPASVLDVLARWDKEADYIILSEIGAWRSCLQWRDDDRDPWPPPPSTLIEETGRVCDCVRDTTGLDTKCFHRVANAARTWLLDRDHKELPPQKELHLDLRVAQAALHLSRFPLSARVVSAAPAAQPWAIHCEFIGYALRARDACCELIREWPAASEARWRYYHAVILRYTKDVAQTPLSLSINEARRNGELSTVAPMLKALDAGLSKYMYLFVEQPQGNLMIGEPSALNSAINDIAPYLGDDFPVQTQNGPGRAATVTGSIKTTKRRGRPPKTRMNKIDRVVAKIVKLGQHERRKWGELVRMYADELPKHYNPDALRKQIDRYIARKADNNSPRQVE